MAAPLLESLTSISSSARTDGLGRRELFFDRETGEMLERLHACPEVSAFQSVVEERIERLTDFTDPRFVRVRAVERVDGVLTVLSDFAPGQTLADLFDAARDLSIVPGLDAALGYLVEALDAVAALHRATGCAHGLIAPERTIVTADGGLVFLDSTYATVVERLALSPRRQWDDFGIRNRPAAAPSSLEPADDLSQVAISSVMLILGRRLELEDVEQMPALMADVAEVALIRGSVAFAQGLQALLERLLPLQDHAPYPSADDAIVTLRELLEREIGLDACRSALVDFIGQCNRDPADESVTSIPAADHFNPDDASAADFAAWPDEDVDADRDPTPGLTEEHEPAPAAEAEDAPVEFEISLDEGDEHPPRAAHGTVSLGDENDEDDAQLFDFSNFDLSKNIGAITPNVLRRIEPPVDLTPPEPPLDELDAAALAPPSFLADAFTFAPAHDPVAGSADPTAADTPQTMAAPFSGLVPQGSATAESGDAVGAGQEPATVDWPAAASDRPIQLVAGVKPRESALFGPGPAYGEVVPASPPGAEAVHAGDGDTSASPRRKRHKKAGRAQKDKLRSVAKPDETTTAAAGATPAWLVPPEKQAKFDQVAPEPMLSPFRPAVVQTPAAPSVPLPFAAPVPPVTITRAPLSPLAPVVAAPPPPTAPLPKFDPPPAIKPIAPPPAAASTISVIEPEEVFAPVKIKADLPSGYSPAVKAAKAAERARPTRHIVEELPESLPEVVEEPVVVAAPRLFPFKLAAALIVLVVVAVLVGRASLPGGALNKASAQTPALPTTEEPAEADSGT
ncbi:MAG: hypothetical protein ABI211_04315, partial [Vicinamibacterales bacterium]